MFKKHSTQKKFIVSGISLTLSAALGFALFAKQETTSIFLNQSPTSHSIKNIAHHNILGATSLTPQNIIMQQMQFQSNLLAALKKMNEMGSSPSLKLQKSDAEYFDPQ